MKKTLFALAAGLLALSVSAVSAMPTAAGRVADGARSTSAATSEVQPAQYRGNRNWNKRYHRNRHMHRHDRRYNRYSGWNRYNSRPYSWRSRGCVAVGPIWFCP